MFKLICNYFKKKKKGFTLIELLAVIVILGILMLIAIPSVTKYIDSAKKESYIKSVNSMIDVVRYGVVSNDSKYSMEGVTRRKFKFSDIEVEKGSKKSPYGEYDYDYSFVVVTKVDNGYKYEVQVMDEKGMGIELINVDNLNKSKVVKCSLSSMEAYSKAYQIGDTVEFAGSNWYVIDESGAGSDYVTVMKEKSLTNAELGSYGIDYVCSESDINYKDYGCRPEKTIVEYSSMSYYYSDKCHKRGTYGYTKEDYSECMGHNDYEGSKVREFLEGTYIKTLGKDNLKEVNGYKIRLITVDELRTNLGWVNGNSSYADGNNVPRWVDSTTYLTMTPVDQPNALYPEVYGVCSQMLHYSSITNWYCYGNFVGQVRPVINLLKESV